MTSIHGKCFCGSVTYVATSEPTSFQHCHCRQCQHIHGASVISWVGFPTTSITFNDSHHTLTTFNSGRANRMFCNKCGTHLAFHYSQPDQALQQEEFTYVAAPSLVTSVKLGISINKPEFQSRYHIYTESQPSWTKDFVKPF
ncbi:MAG: GFA family protein [Alphaproteobacteria bacterium]